MQMSLEERMNGNGNKLRVAAVGDLHVHENSPEKFRDLFSDVSQKADVLVICGDITHMGLPAEAEKFAAQVANCRVPVLAVLGNHDYQSGHVDEVKKIFKAAKVMLLEEDVFELNGVGFAGVKGFCGGFDKHMLTSFGEDAIKSFVAEAVNESLKLENFIRELDTERIVVALHYAPIAQTLQGEPLEIFPFMGSSRLAEPIDHFEVSAVFHGHSHHGTHQGKTLKGTDVYNCCFQLMKSITPDQPYALIEV
jgi:Icc-related predicted phosphoesterase